MTDNDKILIHIPKGGQYIEILGHRIDGFDSFEAFCEYLKKCADMEDTINRQKAEIEELEAEIDKQYEKARADILGNMADGGTSCHWCIDQHKAEAVKEFAERLKQNGFPHCVKGVHGSLLVCEGDIDNLVKEFTEGSKR